MEIQWIRSSQGEAFMVTNAEKPEMWKVSSTEKRSKAEATAFKSPVQ